MSNPTTASKKAQEEEQFKCPITHRCSTKRMHRRCKGPDCRGQDCYDCCGICQRACREPDPNSPDVWVAPEGDQK